MGGFDNLAVAAATAVPAAIKAAAVFVVNGAAAPVPVSIAAGTIAVVDQGDRGSIAQSWYVQLTDGSNPITSINQGGILTIAAAVVGATGGQVDTFAGGVLKTRDDLQVYGAGVEATAQRVNLATDGMAAPLGVRGAGASSATTLRIMLADEAIKGIATGIASAPYQGDLINGVETAVAGSAVQIAAANANAVYRIVQNTGVANIRVGITGVAATTGLRLAPGESVTFGPPYCPGDALFAIREGSVSSIAMVQEVQF